MYRCLTHTVTKRKNPNLRKFVLGRLRYLYGQSFIPKIVFQYSLCNFVVFFLNFGRSKKIITSDRMVQFQILKYIHKLQRIIYWKHVTTLGGLRALLHPQNRLWKCLVEFLEFSPFFCSILQNHNFWVDGWI